MSELTVVHKQISRNSDDLSVFKGVLKGKINRMTKEERQKLFSEFEKKDNSNSAKSLNLSFLPSKTSKYKQVSQ